MSTHSAECWPRRRGWTLIRKTSLLHKIGPMARRSSFANKIVLQLTPRLTTRASAENDLEIVKDPRRNTLHDPTRIDLLFTMSEITHAAPSRNSHAKLFVFADIRRARRSTLKPSGGARRDRTDDLMLAKHALSQLSYGPVPEDEATSC
jgi:hypothetical protein